MKNCLTAIAIMLFALPHGARGAVYKCTDAGGAVRYQDQPCGAGERQREIQSRRSLTVEGADIELVQLVVPGVGTAFVGLLDEMEHKIRKHGDAAVTIAIRSTAEQHPMEMQITFFANKTGGAPSRSQVSDQLAAISPALRQPSMPPGSERWSFKTAIGDATMLSHYAPGGGSINGEWDTSTVGHVAHPRVIAAVTILNNGKTSEGLRRALKVYNMFQVAVGSKLLE